MTHTVDAARRPTKPRQGRTNFKKELSKPTSFELVHAGAQALAALNQYRLLTAWQLAKLLFLGEVSGAGTPRGPAAAKSAVNHYCLRRLKDLGLVTVKRVGYYNQRGLPVATECNLLTRAGMEKLRELWEEAGIEPMPRWTPEVARWMPDKPVHFFRVNDALIAFEAAAKFAGLEVVSLLDDVQIKQLKADGSWRSGIEPDGFVHLSDGARDWTFLPEVDNDTEPLEGRKRNAWLAKIEAYAELFGAIKRGSEPFFAGLPRPLVPTFAPTPKRAEKLLETTIKAGGRSNYWFADFAALENPPSFFEHRFAVPFDRAGRTIAGKLQQ